MNERYTKVRRTQRISTPLGINEMDPTPTETLTTTEKSLRDAKLNMLTTLLCPTKGCEGLLCQTHDNAEVERSLSENSKVLTSEQSLLSDYSINAIRLTKHDI